MREWVAERDDLHEVFNEDAIIETVCTRSIEHDVVAAQLDGLVMVGSEGRNR